MGIFRDISSSWISLAAQASAVAWNSKTFKSTNIIQRHLPFSHTLKWKNLASWTTLNVRRKDCITSASCWLNAERWTLQILPYCIVKEKNSWVLICGLLPKSRLFSASSFFLDFLCMPFSPWHWSDQDGNLFRKMFTWFLPLSAFVPRSLKVMKYFVRIFKDVRNCGKCHYSYFGMIFVLNRNSYHLKTDLEESQIQITGGLLFPMLIYSPRVIPKHNNYRHNTQIHNNISITRLFELGDKTETEQYNSIKLLIFLFIHLSYSLLWFCK